MFEKLPEACASGSFLRRKREMAPMGNAAAFPEHLAEGNSTAQVHWCTARSPDVSLRGAKRRGNLAVLGRIIGYFRRKRNCLPEIATSACGLLAMTNLMAVTILSTAYTSWEFCAGPGCPLPYNSVCGWRSTREPAASMAFNDHRYRQTPARRGCRRAGNCF